MRKNMLQRMAFIMCLLLSMALFMPALASSVEDESMHQPEERPLTILLNGEPVEKTVLNLSKGNQLQFTATQPVTWKSSKAYRGEINQSGLLTSITTGTITVTATNAEGEKATCEVRMVRLVNGITITGSSEAAAGKRIQLKAVIAPSNAADKNLKWSSSDTSVATVNSRGYVTAKEVAGTRSVVIRAEAKDGSGVYAEHTVTVRPGAQSVRIFKDGKAVDEVYVDINAASNVKLDTSVLPAAASQDVTWKSNSSRVTVGADGTITAHKTGTATVTATAADGTGRKASVKVRVVRMVQDIDISGSNALTGGRSISLSAKVVPSNASEKSVKWSSSDESAATVNRYGKVTAKRLNEVRTVVITAEAKDGSGVIARHTVTVTPPIESMAIVKDGERMDTVYVDINQKTVDLDALIQPAAACQDVKWKVNSSKRASIDENGVLTAKSTGTVTVTASAQDGSSKKATVKVRIVRSVQSITVTGDEMLTGGRSGTVKAKVLPSNATEDGVTWSSSDPDVLTVNKYGALKAAKADSAKQVTITATAKDGSGVIGTMVVTVVPAAKSVSIFKDGEAVSELTVDILSTPKIDLDALISPADASQDVKWKSNSSRAKIDQNGVVTFNRTGSATITATAQDGSGRKATVKITVIRAVQSITLSGDTMVAGRTSGELNADVLPANATNDDVTWSSSDPELLTINKYGSFSTKEVSAATPVTVTAAAKDGSGVVGSITVTIMPRTQKVNILSGGKVVDNVGVDLAGTKKLQLSAAAEPAGALQNVRWTTSNKKRATVDENGVVTGIKAGTVTITATATDGTGVRGSVTVNVGIMVRKLTVSGAQQVSGGKSVQLDATAYPANATKKDVVWSSSNEAAAKVSSSGKVTAAAVDAPTQVTITAAAKDGGGVTAQHTLTIIPSVRSIVVSRTDAKLAGVTLILDANGGTAQLQATCYPALANQKVSWKSSNSNIVKVDENGRVTAVGTGLTSVVASAQDGSGTKAVLWVGTGDLSTIPYYFEVDRVNQVVRVYERGADNTYSTLIKRMICSSGRTSTPGLDNGLYSMNGGKLYWMDGVAIYATRIKGHYLFHSVTYKEKSMSALNSDAYNKLGTKASGGCIRLLAGDAKWIYDNAFEGCFVSMMDGVRDIKEYGAVTKPALVSGKWDPTNPHPGNPDFDPTYTSDVK